VIESVIDRANGDGASCLLSFIIRDAEKKEAHWMHGRLSHIDIRYQ
jgi:hypothetical protein